MDDATILTSCRTASDALLAYAEGLDGSLQGVDAYHMARVRCEADRIQSTPDIAWCILGLAAIQEQIIDMATRYGDDGDLLDAHTRCWSLLPKIDMEEEASRG